MHFEVHSQEEKADLEGRLKDEATQILSSDAWRKHLDHPGTHVLNPIEIEVRGGDDEHSPQPVKPTSEDFDNPYFRPTPIMGCACGEEFDVEEGIHGLGRVRSYAAADSKENRMYRNATQEETYR